MDGKLRDWENSSIPSRKRRSPRSAAKTKKTHTSIPNITSDESSDEDLENFGPIPPLIDDKQYILQSCTPQNIHESQIKNLLKRLFLDFDVNVTELAKVIIKVSIEQTFGSLKTRQKYKKNKNDGPDDTVFAVTTIINITDRKESCVQQIRTLLQTLAKKHAKEKTTSLIEKILSNDSGDTGLVIHERELRFPAFRGVGLMCIMDALRKQAVIRGWPLTFKYLVFICKTYVIQQKMIFANQEESVIEQFALDSIDVDVSDRVDFSQAGYSRDEMQPHRKVLIVEGGNMKKIIKLMKEQYCRDKKKDATDKKKY